MKWNFCFQDSLNKGLLGTVVQAVKDLDIAVIFPSHLCICTIGREGRVSEHAKKNRKSIWSKRCMCVVHWNLYI